MISLRHLAASLIVLTLAVSVHADPTLPDFPASQRHQTPVTNINDAVVYTMNEGTFGSDYGMGLARKVGSDVLIRAWFKWNQAPPVSAWQHQPAEAHQISALFGGGITCSALYDGENGLTHDQVLDMATRGPDGKLVDAWGTAGIRHGSLSSPAYLDYLFRWCREQIDAGVDYLFMDENTAALQADEGYDDHSLSDFRYFLTTVSTQTTGWKPDDAGWRSQFGIDLGDRSVCPSGSIDSFDYRAYLKTVTRKPTTDQTTRLAGLWSEFRQWRDDRAWKSLTDRIRAYSSEHKRHILISGNGNVKYVDLQVLGVWYRWETSNGHIDLKTNMIPTWRSVVTNGRDVAERKVPVVIFHDWGFGPPPFPWMTVPASERAVWMRTRGAEIYASGGFFAFPVLGPFGCDAGKDGTLPLIAHLSAFYQNHRDLYLRSSWVGSESLHASPLVSLAAGWQDASHTLVLHVINRDVRDGVLFPQRPVVVNLPLSAKPIQATVISPDFEGRRPAVCRMASGSVQLTLPTLDAYSVVLLRYAGKPDMSRLRDAVRVHPDGGWNRPSRSEFPVLADGSVQHASDLVNFLQGMLHSELRNPPTFEVISTKSGELQVHIRSVATMGARIQISIDGRIARTVDLPDRDGKNDATVPEYDRTISVSIPAGRHRVTVDNVGGDWATIDWYQFIGVK